MHFPDIDECSENNGGCEDQCEDTVGSFVCLCTAPGLKVDEVDMFSCVGMTTECVLCNTVNMSPYSVIQSIHI